MKEQNCDLIHAISEPAPFVRKCSETNLDLEDNGGCSSKSDAGDLTSSEEGDIILYIDWKLSKRNFFGAGDLSKVIEESSFTENTPKSNFLEN